MFHSETPGASPADPFTRFLPLNQQLSTAPPLADLLHIAVCRLFNKGARDQIMAMAVVDFIDVAGQWRMARRMYPVYLSLVSAGDSGVAPCRELESPVNRSKPEVLKRVSNWFDSVDEKVAAHHLRLMLQTTELTSEENLRDLLIHQLSKFPKSAAVRDKVDYLCVQYYALRSAHDANQDN